MLGPETELVDALEAIVVAGVALTNAVLSRSGRELTFPQWRMLVVLSDPNGLPVAEVSRLIDVTLPATGRQLRRLERRGLVALEPDGRDRRVTRVRLTASGLEVRRSIIAGRRAAIEHLVADVRLGRDVVESVGRIADALAVGVRWSPGVSDRARPTSAA
jgi:DNA-binding MarR family transcriptional regulator